MRLLPDRNPVDQFPNRDQTFFLLLEFGIARPHGVSFDGFRDREFLLSEPAIRILPIQSAPKSCAKMGFSVGPSTGRHHHLPPLWGIALQRTGAGGRTKLLVALSLLVFVTRNGWLWVTATTGAGASYCPLSAPWRRTIPCSLPCSLRLQMGALEPASFWGSSAPLAGGAVQLG